MPLILGTNSIKDTGYDVANSLRFNSGSSDYLTRTSGTPTSNQKGTLSFWLKRSILGNKRIYSNYVGTDDYVFIDFRSDDKLRINVDDEGILNISTNRVFRDTSAWYHIVFAVDTTQGTASNRCKIYVNGVLETSFLTATYPNQNVGLNMFNASVSNGSVIGAFYNGSGYFEFQDGYFSEFCLIDGQQLDPTSFGEFDSDTNIWKPIDVSGLTFGNSGFYLDFENSGSLGADVSGNGNNFTVNNLTSIDQSTDTCTNNFSTLNPLIPIGGTFSEGNLQHTRSSAGYRSAVSSIGVSSGKWYVEIKSPDSENIGVGVINGDNSSGLYMSGSEQFLGQHSYDVGYYFNGVLYVGNSSQSGSWTSYTSNDIIGIAIDVDNGFVYFSKNGTFVNSGDPTSGATGTGGYNLSGIGSNGTYFIGCSTGNNSEHYVNFGNSIFTISSGNSDGNGYGNMEFAVPSGYYVLNSKNLAEYG